MELKDKMHAQFKGVQEIESKGVKSAIIYFDTDENFKVLRVFDYGERLLTVLLDNKVQVHQKCLLTVGVYINRDGELAPKVYNVEIEKDNY